MTKNILLNMTNRAQICKFYQEGQLEEILSFKPEFLKYGDLSGVCKLATNAKNFSTISPKL